MKSLFFWNDWKKPYKYLYLSLFSILILTLALYLISYFIGINAMIDWEVKSSFDSLKVSVDQFTKNLFNYSVETNNYLIREKYFSSDIQVNPLFAYIYFSLVMIGILIALTVITRLELIGFAVGMGIFIFFIVYLHTELLEIFGDSTKRFTVIAIILYTGLGFYYQAYDKKLSFIQRLLSFILLTIILGIVIGYGAKTENPFFYMANFGIVIPIVLTVIFITFIGFDIINGFLFLTTGPRAGGKNTIFHFILISGLYLVNLLLIYLKKKGILTSDFIYVDVFFIYLASALVGIWGTKKRTPLFESIINASNASFLYIALAIISTATIVYSFITGNDPLTSALQYAILYSHLGMGLVFFLYIIYNFWELFYKNISAYELVYAPRRMPFFMVRPLGLVIMISLFMQSGKYPYKLAKAGYYNYLGDVFVYNGKLKEAAEIYNESSIYGADNRRSNYSLATTLTLLDKKREAITSYKETLERYPSEYVYVNLGNLYMETDQFFPALFTLKDGLKEFPESGFLHNNIALVYSSKGMWDSTFMHLNQAKKYLKKKDAISSNYIWFLARKNIYEGVADSILQHENFENSLAYQNNKIAILTLNEKKFEGKLKEEFLKDSILNGSFYCYLYNYTANQAKSSDTTVLQKINYYNKYEGNIDYYFELSFLKCLKLYYSGECAKAIRQLKDLSQTASTETTVYYNKILGLWAIEQDAYYTASDFFKEAVNLVDPKTQYELALSLLEAGETERALELFNQIKNTPEKSVKTISENILLISSTKDLNEVKNWNDTLKFHFLHFRKDQMEEPILLQTYSMFESENFKILGGAELMKHYLDQGELEKAAAIWNNLAGLVTKKSKSAVYAIGELNYQYLHLLEIKQDWKTLNETAKNIQLNKSQESNRNYFLAVSEETTGQEKTAESHYATVLKRRPYNANAFIKAGEFYNKKENFDKAYEILIEGIYFNEYSAELYMAYVLQALKLNLTSYAEESLDKIKELTSPEEFAAFKKIYEQEKATAEKQFEQF